MNVLIACEFSGVVRDAFLRAGHNALSCDLLPTQNAGPHHQGDVLELLTTKSFDLMIAHPPCTDLAVSGARYFRRKRADGSQRKSIDFFMALVNTAIPRVCIENPVGIMSTKWRKPDQIIQPWQFGHPESKATCLWLKNLPPLKPTRILNKPPGKRWDNQTPSGQNRLGPSDDRWKMRSITYAGIARAMAAQWGRI